MKNIFITLFILFLSIFPSNSQASISHSQKPIIIQDDPGGDVDEFAKWYKRLKESGTPIKIDGGCASACTLVLILPKEQVCVTPRASLGFHLAAIQTRSGMVFDPELTDILIKRYYPEIVQKWIDTRRPLSQRVIYLSFDQIVAFQIFDECK